jgi:tRNA 2-selenouridine synthase
MAVRKIDVTEFLENAASVPVIDVRSPSEFREGHIPGAFNIPIFDDAGRAAVGTRYKKEGRVPAIVEGLRHSGPEMSKKLQEAVKLAKQAELLIHCWRGGMRSEAMAWLFSLADINVKLLNGGYKSYRNHVLDCLSEKRKVIVLGGMTGSSKTHILRSIKNLNYQVVDLEGLANHKGSAFGSLGQPPQPSTEQFGNLLFDKWRSTSKDEPVWVEDESRNIGSVFLPDQFYFNMQQTPAIILMMDIKTRLPRLMEEYSQYPPELLISSILRITKRLGGDNTRDAISAVEDGDISKAIEISLYYYDKAYMYGLKKKSEQNLIFIETDTDDIETNAEKVISAASKIKW